MTITLNSDQEEAIRAAIRAGQVASVEELIDRALAGLTPHTGIGEAPTPSTGITTYEQGLGLFGSPEDSALLDDVVALAYEERRRPTKRGTTL